MSLRPRILAHLGPQAWLKSSYIPGRSGFLVQSQRSLSDLRADLVPRYARRLTEVHRKSGRFFAEPSHQFLLRSLRGDRPSTWWSGDHQTAAQIFFLPWRADRVRRSPRPSPPVSPSHRRRTLGFLAVRDLALRLEALAATPRPDKHWRGLAQSFDELWRGVALQSAPLNPLTETVFAHLQRCFRQLEDYPLR